MRTSTSALIVTLTALLACAASFGRDTRREDCSSNVLLEWNKRVLTIGAAEDGLLTLKTVRTTAMMHVAIHDAINSVHRHYEHYAFEGADVRADPVVAAAQAAFEIASSQYPQHELELRKLLADSLQARDPATRRRSVELGKQSAAAILDARVRDGWNIEHEYRWRTPAPGVYADFSEHSATPPGFVFGAGWAHVRPFLLRRPNRFRVESPPTIESDAYTAAFNEVKQLGSYASNVRSAEQTHIAYWWKEFAESSLNRLARRLIAERGTDLWTAARTLALLNTAIFDGYIASFDSKFAYNHWRPYTAIRSAAHDGNPHTAPDLNWTNTHGHTYPFPSYPSAHGTVCAAGMSVLADTFGATTPFDMETREVPVAGPMSRSMELEPSLRHFDSFEAAAMECALSRVYLGIHFRYDSLVGNALGGKVGRYAIERHLVPVE